MLKNHLFLTLGIGLSAALVLVAACSSGGSDTDYSRTETQTSMQYEVDEEPYEEETAMPERADEPLEQSPVMGAETAETYVAEAELDDRVYLEDLDPTDYYKTVQSMVLGETIGELELQGCKYTIYEKGAEFHGPTNEKGVPKSEVEFEGKIYPVRDYDIYTEYYRETEIPASVEYIERMRTPLESLVIPDTVKYIPTYGSTFFGENLRSIHFKGYFASNPEWQTTFIDGRPNDKLEEVIFDKTPYMRRLYATFANCSAFRHFVVEGQDNVIPEGVVDMTGTFQYCRSLDHITLPSTLETIGANTFLGCAMEEIKIPSSVTRLSLSAFCDMPNLETLVLPDSVVDLSSDSGHVYGLSNCPSLKGIKYPVNADLGNLLKDSGNYSGCPNLQVIIMPDHITDMDPHAFDGVEHPENLTVQFADDFVEYARSLFPQIHVVGRSE